MRTKYNAHSPDDRHRAVHAKYTPHNDWKGNSIGSTHFTGQGNDNGADHEADEHNWNCLTGSEAQ
jgi:hypothetical protein